MDRPSAPRAVRAGVLLLGMATGAALLATARALPPVDLAAAGLGWALPALSGGLLLAASAAAVASLVGLLRHGGAGAAATGGASAVLAAAAVIALGGGSLEIPVAVAASLLLAGAVSLHAEVTIAGARARIAAAALGVAVAELVVLAELLVGPAAVPDGLRTGVAWAGAALASGSALLLAGRPAALVPAGVAVAAASIAVGRGPGLELAIGLACLTGAGLAAIVTGWPQGARQAAPPASRLPELAARVSDALLAFDGHLRLRDWNARAAGLLGLDDASAGIRIEDLLGVQLAELPHGEAPALISSRVGGLVLELARAGDGVTAIIRDPDPSPDAERLARELRGTIEELLQARRTIELQRDEIERATTVDPLTGVATRSAIVERLATEVAQARRYAHPVAAVLVDIDGFSEINHAHGTAGGDAALREIALRLRLRIREADAIGRAGSDAFLAVLPHTDEAGAATFADALRGRVAQRPVAIGAEQVAVTLSIGVAVMRPGEELDVDGLLGRADEALASARAAGGDRIALDRLHGLARLEEHRPAADLAGPRSEGEGGS